MAASKTPGPAAPATAPAKKPKKRLTDAARLKRMATDAKWFQKQVDKQAAKKKK